MTHARSSDSALTVRHIARIVLLAFLLTFITTRVLVLLIMTHRIPDLYLHLGGGYWQRASFDAIVVLAGVLGLVSFAPRLDRGRSTYVATLLIIGAAVAFGVFLVESFRVANQVEPRLQQLESGGPR